ncbi:hypothetical protein J7E81_07950 [Bacillus sp. ISL-18]|uniref:hypothetical protein n=1 Tax=Bacillus sp. ISL-18 TaxID=2819118 RepID=UPI001BEA1164|nr:hypothetical protein [Bacillus sp. ISL-18]MBT2655174.1 hypothetical protein [Bacillus sp. ISL-18]
MNTKVKKGVFWGVIVAATVLVFNVLHLLLGGDRGRVGGRGPGGMAQPSGAGQQGGIPQQGGLGQRGGFDHHHMMNGAHHGGGFPWLFLIIGLAVLVLLVRWLRKKAKASSMKQFIDTSLAGSHIPVTNQNASILDQWEKNLLTKKENE